MNVLTVMNRFEEPIVMGRKPHSIRPHRKDGRARAKVGETISIRVWTGKPYRSKQREIARALVDFIFPIRITTAGIYRLDVPQPSSLVKNMIAVNDGFASWPEMRDWFEATHGLPFEGVLIHWTIALDV